jgi:FdhD protein
MAETSRRVPSRRVSQSGVGAAVAEDTNRLIPEEVPVALVYDGSTHAVMMATPADLEDFAVGFSITEGVVAARSEIRDFEVVEHEKGLEARMWLVPDAGRRVGHSASTTAEQIHEALGALPPAQTLNVATRAVHAAAFWDAKAAAIAFVREDVGRHNALDKLVGAVATARLDPAKGFVILTSRVSVEMVQKTAMLGAEIIVAVSAPTALALRVAEEAGITLVAIARPDAFEIFTHPDRITLPNERGEGIRQEVHAHARSLSH